MAPDRRPPPALRALDARDPVARAAAAAALGLTSRPPAGTARALLRALDDGDPRVRAAALGALARTRARVAARTAWRRALVDVHPSVRRRAAEVAPALDSGFEPRDRVQLRALLDDEPLVAEAAAHALGELAGGDDGRVVALSEVATGHADPLVREAAVAAIGALGDDAGLPAVLAACTDKPAIRRRAVVALAAFEGPAVEAALQRALEDRDWQVRQTAEDLQLDQLR